MKLRNDLFLLGLISTLILSSSAFAQESSSWNNNSSSTSSEEAGDDNLVIPPPPNNVEKVGPPIPTTEAEKEAADQARRSAQSQTASSDDSSSDSKEVIMLAETKLNPVFETINIDSSYNRKQRKKEDPKFYELTLSGILRNQLTFIQNDSTLVTGGHDGFNVTHARLALSGDIKKLFGFTLTFDGGVTAAMGSTDVTRYHAGLADAYVYTTPVRYVNALVGHFVPPFDIESRYSTANRLFANLSIVYGGIKAGEGKPVSGLGRAREIGASIYANNIYFASDDNSPKGLGFTYNVSVTNGSSGRLKKNDNDSFAVYTLLGIDWEKFVALNVSGYYNPTSTYANGVRIDNRKIGVSADLSASFFGLDFFGSYTQVMTTPGDVQNAVTTTARGFHTELLFDTGFWGLTPGIRYAYLDPSNQAEKDAIHEITGGINLNYPGGYPFRAAINYTANLETGTAVSNDRVDLVVQATF